ncbi:lysophospholipid acyltransferase family protein [Ekhidna sp.]|uniref:lysophospholipid acyltransferase family protein n=1 Tax=Ekhidna sp. TaxID=2608089 RepID=UPI003CCBA178
MNVVYACIRLLMRFSLRLYFHKIKIEGIENVPKNVPLLVTPNHQNALLDPLLVGAFIPIPLHYLTRSDVFNKWTSPLLKLINMMPIYRIRDGYSKLSQNDQVFDACFNIFKQNQSVLIFAEGNHGKEYYLRPLTKGAARLAIQSQLQLDEKLHILPVGLNFFEHRKSQSTVLIKFGEPVAVSPFVSGFEQQQAKGLIAMREAISKAMKLTLVIPEETADYEERKQLIFQRKHEALSFDELKNLNIKETSYVKRKPKKHRLARFLNPLPFYIIGRKLRKTDDVVFHATFKLSIGLIAFPLWWLTVFLLLSLTVGINIGILAVIVMVLGLFYSYQR